MTWKTRIYWIIWTQSKLMQIDPRDIFFCIISFFVSTRSAHWIYWIGLSVIQSKLMQIDLRDIFFFCIISFFVSTRSAHISQIQHHYLSALFCNFIYMFITWIHYYAIVLNLDFFLEPQDQTMFNLTLGESIWQVVLD